MFPPPPTLLARLDLAGFGFKKSLRARVCYLAGDWTNACAHWESANDKNSKEYREAKARVAPYPERLSYLKDLAKHDVILEEYAANSSVPLDGEANRILGIAISTVNRFGEALEHFASVGAISELGELAVAASASGEREVAEKALQLCAVLTVQQSHWASVRDYLNSGNFPKASKETHKALAALLRSIRPRFDCLLAASFARSDSLTKLDSSEQKPISKFLRDLERSRKWQTFMSVEELGAAIERSQRFVDAVEYYESLLTSATSDAQKRFALVRWVKSRERLETFYQGEKQYRRADGIRDERAKAITTHQILPVELAVEYPELDSLNELLLRELQGGEISVVPKTLTKQAATEFTGQAQNPPPALETSMQPPPAAPIKADPELIIGQLKLKLSRDNARINLEHLMTSKTATIRLSPVRCSSDDVAWISVESGSKIHKCGEWGLEADFSRLETERLIVLRFPNARIEILLGID